MMNKNKFRLFYFFFFAILNGAYLMVHGFPTNLQELLHAVLAVSFLTTTIIIVFIVTSLTFGLPIDKILKQINNK